MTKDRLVEVLKRLSDKERDILEALVSRGENSLSCSDKSYLPGIYEIGFSEGLLSRGYVVGTTRYTYTYNGGPVSEFFQANLRVESLRVGSQA